MTKRQMRHPEKFIGKRINTTKWIMSDGYNVCALTGKFYPENELGITFNYYAFDKKFLLDNGIYVEDADWLSQEGWEIIQDTLKRLGAWDRYLESFE